MSRRGDIVAITNRASWRLAPAAPLMGDSEFEAAHRKIECAVRDLTHLAERIEKEHEHVEPKSTDCDSGAALAGSLETRDRPSPEHVAFECAQSPAVKVTGIAGTGPSRESRSLPNPDLGTVGQPQRESGPGP